VQYGFSMKYRFHTLFFLLSLAVSAEMILHEPFDVKIQKSEPILGNQNGWQFGFNDTSRSQAMVREGAVHKGVSPFPEKGVCLHPQSTKTSAYKPLPETLNGKTVYFSYVMHSFKRGNFSGLRFRAKKGTYVSAGLTEDGFTGSVFGKETKGTGIGEIKTRYFVVGKVEFSEEGHAAKLSFTWFDNVNDIPNPAPEEWPVELEAKTGPQEWNAVELFVASGSTAFDDLRISTKWTDVAGQ